MSGPVPLYSGEAILLSWGESHRDGRVVRFKIEEDGTHPFKGLETGVNGGQRFMLVAVPIQNDGAAVKPVSAGTQNGDGKSNLAGGSSDLTHSGSGGTPEALEQKPPAKPNIHIRRFMALAHDRGFWNYLRRVKGKVVMDEAQAVATLKGLCNIVSREELTDDADGSVALRTLANQFNTWMRGNA